MSVTSAYSLSEAREMLEKWKACERALAEGQAKAYRIGTREFTAFDLDEVRRMIDYFGNVVEALSGTVRTTKVTRVVPRDL